MFVGNVRMKKQNAQKYEVNRKKIEQLASYGNTYDEIANVLNVSSGILRKSYSQFYTKGRENLNQRLRKKQINVALKGNVVMLIWLGKNYLGQKDKEEVAGGLTQDEINRLRSLAGKDADL